MKKIFFTLTLLFQMAFAYPPLPEAQSEQEALFVRRIIDFWRDQEYPFAKSQINSFLSQYPNSPFAEHFNGMLGDIAMHEKNYTEAITYYNKISSEALLPYIYPKRWQALYLDQRYAQLYEELASQELENDEEQFYFAEAAFRQALTQEKEKAEALLLEALPIYASLQGSENFSLHAKLAMAEIYRALHQPEKSARLYLEISENKEDNEDILFHAAAMLMQCNLEKAATIFQNIAKRGSERAPDAAYQWMQILANQGEWETIKRERKLWLKKIPKKQLSSAYFYLGMIAFEEKQYNQAVSDLRKALENGVGTPYDRSALEALLTSSKELGNLPVCETSYDLLVSRYPELKPEGSYLRATAYRKGGEPKRALTLFEEVIQQFPQHIVAEKATLEKVQLLMKAKFWEEAHSGVLDFLKKYSHSEKKGEMLRLAIDLSRMQASESQLYTRLAGDLERALAEHIFQGKERKEKLEMLAKCYLNLDQIHAALGILHEMEDPDPLLFTQCYVKEDESPEKVVSFGERALERYPDHDRLHLHLFNAYLKLAQKNHDEELTKRAAQHLNSVIDVYPVTLENRLWLAHYFAKEENERAITLLESLFQTESSWKRFEKEGVLLARLYFKKGDTAKALPLLQHVIQQGEKNQLEAELLLGEVYEKLGEMEKANSIFAKLEDAPQLPISYAAQLHMARLHFKEKPEKSLKKLYNLKVRKNLASEPVHLEAALDLADLQASLLPEKERFQGLLKALLEVKDEFTTDRDICSKDYHESRQLMPEQERIYQAYMRYLDARIYLLQAKLTQDIRERKAKENAAQALFSSLYQGKYAITPYLVERVIVGMRDEK